MKNLETFEEFLNESLTRASDKKTRDQIHKETEIRIKDQIVKYSGLMKTKPEDADIYKAQLDLTNAKMMVLKLKKKLDDLKSK
jgi:predicted translin family RNA/ssDNA-binding protein